MTLAIERLVVRVWRLTASTGWNAGFDVPGREFGPELGAVIAAVGDQAFGWRQGVEQKTGTFVVTHLAFAQQYGEWPAQVVANCMKFGVQFALRAPDTAGNGPFFTMPLITRWSSTRGTPCDNGKCSEIRAIRCSLRRNKSPITAFSTDTMNHRSVQINRS